jgi:4-amino-4-deoxy-L-arabinose transferase-like glycosyltransferase
LLAALFMSGTTLLVYVLTRSILSHTIALTSATLFASSTGISAFWPGAEPEHFMLLSLVGAFVCGIRGMQRGGVRWFVVAGILGGVAFMTRQVSVADFVVLFVAVVVWAVKTHAGNRRFLAPGALALGFALAMLVTIIPLLAAGASDGLRYAFLDVPRVYAQSLSWAEKWAKGWEAAGNVAKEAGPWMVLAVLGGWTLLRGRRRMETVLPVAWLGAAVLAVVSTGWFHPYYFTHLLPPLAVLAAVGVTMLWPLPALFLHRCGV